MKKNILVLALLILAVMNLSNGKLLFAQENISPTDELLKIANETIHNQELRIRNLLAEKDRLLKLSNQTKSNVMHEKKEIKLEYSIKQNNDEHIILLRQQNDELKKQLQERNDDFDRISKKAQENNEKLMKKEDKFAALREENEALRVKVYSYRKNDKIEEKDSIKKDKELLGQLQEELKSKNILLEEKSKIISDYDQKIALFTQQLNEKEVALQEIEKKNFEYQTNVVEKSVIQSLSDSDMDKIKEPLVSEIGALRDRIVYLEERLNDTVHSTQNLLNELESNPKFKELNLESFENNNL